MDDWWDEGKREIKRLSIDYCKKHASARRAERDLVRLADFLKQGVDSGAMFCFGPYQFTLSSLAKFDLDAAHGAQVHSRTRWVEEGESSSSYFFRLVKKQGAERLVSALRLDDGSIVNSAPDVVDFLQIFILLSLLRKKLTVFLRKSFYQRSLRVCLLISWRFVRVCCQLMNVFLLLRGWLIVRLLEMMVSRWSFM